MNKVNEIEYIVLKITKDRGNFKLDRNGKGELFDIVIILETKGYLKSLGHSDKDGMWLYKITTKGCHALDKSKAIE
ncbi:MAG: hypothetical protein QXU18_12630 [Thermoplasmatales archaeon]